MALWRKELLLAHTLSPPIQITQAFATPDAGRVGPRARFKIYWKEGGSYYILQRRLEGGMLSKLQGEYN